MRVFARPVDYAACPPSVAMYVNREQAHITPGTEYMVHALVVFGGVTLLQVVDDLGYPSWKPAWLFGAADNSLDEDWICSVFPDDEPQLVIGPRFLAQDLASYSQMVELEPEQVKRFWKRLEARTKTGVHPP